MAHLLLIDHEQGILDMLDKIKHSGMDVPDLFCDLEGNNLGKHGTISLLTLYVKSIDNVYLIDITTLGVRAFDISAPDGKSLRYILESPEYLAAFFDVRCDSNALFHIYGVRLAGVWDIQLMELATRNESRRTFVCGLARAIQFDAGLDDIQMKKWLDVKDKGRRLFAPELGGAYTLFDERPLSGDLIAYSVQDVTYLPQLWCKYVELLSNAEINKIMHETESRVSLSQRLDYNPRSRENAKGPPSWQPVQSSENLNKATESSSDSNGKGSEAH